MRGHAAWALGEIGGAEAALKEALEEEPNSRCKEEIWQALKSLPQQQEEASNTPINELE